MKLLQRLRDAYQFNQARRDQWMASQAARIPAGARVLDVGAGTGLYRPLFSHCQYFTHDFASEPNTIGRYTKLDYTSDITAIPVPDGSFDVIVCTEVLEHVPEPGRALKEFGRIVKGGGKVLLSAPLNSRLHQEPFHFYGGYTPHWYKRFLPEAGFTVESVERNQGFFSYFGQEGLRFSALIDPRRTTHLGLAQRIWSGLIWLVTLPFLRVLFPFAAPGLDAMNLENDATVGYHVVAVRDSAGK